MPAADMTADKTVYEVYENAYTYENAYRYVYANTYENAACQKPARRRRDRTWTPN
ncbi:hypothetical protein ACWF94_34725 [Streptomyces sp. NPDC055078]